MIGDCLCDVPVGDWSRARLLPLSPDLVVPSGMGQEVAVWLGLCERGCVHKNCPGAVGLRNAPEDSHRTGHDILR
jgi:hypothetical protein